MSPNERRFPPPWTVEELDGCFVVTDSVVKPAPRWHPRGQYQIESRIKRTPALGRWGPFTQTNRALGGVLVDRQSAQHRHFGPATILNLYKIAHSESTVDKWDDSPSAKL